MSDYFIIFFQWKDSRSFAKMHFCKQNINKSRTCGIWILLLCFCDNYQTQNITPFQEWNTWCIACAKLIRFYMVSGHTHCDAWALPATGVACHEAAWFNSLPLCNGPPMKLFGVGGLLTTEVVVNFFMTAAARCGEYELSQHIWSCLLAITWNSSIQ